MQRHLRHLRSTAAYRWFRNRDVRSFYTSVAAPTVRHGTQALLQVLPPFTLSLFLPQPLLCLSVCLVVFWLYLYSLKICVRACVRACVRVCVFWDFGYITIL